MLKLEIFRRGCYSIHKPCSTEIWEIYRRQPVVSNGTCINYYFKLCFISIVLQRRAHKRSSQQIYSTQTLYRGGGNNNRRRVYAKQRSGKLTYNRDFQLLLLSLLMLSPLATTTSSSSSYKIQVFWLRTHFSCYIYLVNLLWF